MYCEGFWKEGVCIADMHFSGEPTSDGDAVAEYLRVWYEAHRESRWERSKWNTRGRRWEGPWADEFMLGLINEVYRINCEHARQTIAREKGR
jgi:hypothetical protein